ncbi:Low temperature viability protein [Parathielavia appendiculata]|uniref:Low temperature viability protein n=1 Tax=Parathielavia appendiculata TaxID=2587402 RepID=A0AAN6Z7R7_9PEZI|nr:Low temperature viability protein [Parathielavia appendiculata]
MVLAPTQPANKSTKGRGLSDLASELGSDALSIRDNEGEAANYGIYYDDTEYDYMQHLRDLGQGSGEAVFVEAKPVGNKGKAKQHQPLEDALRQLDLQNQTEDLALDNDILPNKNLQRLTYQAQQDVPDAIAGFQPDMDPRLREVLEALEDDAYVDDEGGEDIFQELAKDGEELGLHEFEEVYDEFEEEDEGWESDRTVKATGGEAKDEEAPQLTDTNKAQPGESAVSEDWMEEFKKFKSDQKAEKKPRAAAAPSELQSSIWTTTTNGGRRKTRKGAMTNPSTYSMTSSSLVRTEQLGILDARFEKIEEEYNADMDDLGSVSAVSTMSTVQGPTRQDFDGLLDEFLGDYSMFGKKRVKKGKWKNGIEQFDEIRRELGPPKIPAKYK